jgi:CRISPR-associated protein Cmr2
MLFRFRLENALSQQGEDADDWEARSALVELRQVLKSLPKDVGAPVPYAVILKADGDRMGALLQEARTAGDSRSISRALHGFADAVRAIVRQYHGHAIYAGGDDVLALLPLPDAVPCAKALAKAFAEALRRVAADLELEPSKYPTLSVGLSIGHLMEPLGSLRARANRAERLAKGDDKPKPRNALAILLGIRSGAELEWRANWDEPASMEVLFTLTAAYRDGVLPSRVAYDLRAIDRRLAWLRKEKSPEAAGMRVAEVMRMLDRARIEGGTPELAETTRTLIADRARGHCLTELANTLILARWLSARTAADLGELG